MLLLIVLIFFEVIVFVFLIFLLRRVLSRNITSATQRLDVLTKDYMKKQEDVQKKLDEVKDIYQKKIAEAKEEAEKIRLEAQRQANGEREKIINKTRSETEEMIKQAQKARESLIMDMEKKIKSEAIEMSCNLLGKVLSEELRLMIHKYMVGELLKAGLSSIRNIENIGNVSDAQITTAFELDDAAQRIISSKIKEKTDKDIIFSQRNDSSLIAGLVITMGSLVIDGSLKWMIKEKARDVINES